MQIHNKEMNREIVFSQSNLGLPGKDAIFDTMQGGLKF